MNAQPQVLVAVPIAAGEHALDHPVFLEIKGLLDTLRESKSEFVGIDVHPVPLPLRDEVVPLYSRVLMLFLVYSIPTDFAKSLRWLHEHGSSLPVAVVTQKASLIAATKASLEVGYPHVRSFLLEGNLKDPEDRGVVARLMKDEIRRRLPRGPDGEGPTKKVGWKVENKGGQSYLSLFLDPVMREFIQRLLFVLSRAERPMPRTVDEGRVAEAFTRLGKLATDGKPEKQKPDLLTIEKELQSLFPPTEVAEPGGPLGHILLEGETGTGKTLIAQAIGARLKTGFYHISVVNVGDNILEAELFGTISGAWTGAGSRPGKLLLGRGKTIFLDEIGDLPLRLQTKLLVYLDRQEVVPDGWRFPWPIRSPAYVVAATNRDLRAMIGRGEFREDLYYRFQHRLRVPSLRERRADLRILIDFVLQDRNVNRQRLGGGREVERIEVAALHRLERLEYRGNFRDLQDVLSRAVYRAVTAGRDCIREGDIEA